MIARSIHITALAAALSGIMPAFAASPVELSSSVFVERQVVRADGRKAVILENPKLVTPGDNLVFVVKYRNAGTAPANNIVVTNPMPSAVAFNGTSDGTELVSVDGGNSWGTLPSLRVKDADGKLRAARMTDVTHVKWNVNQVLTGGAEGKLIFRGIVK